MTEGNSHDANKTSSCGDVYAIIPVILTLLFASISNAEDLLWLGYTGPTCSTFP